MMLLFKVLTQARPHIIEKTFKAIEDAVMLSYIFTTQHHLHRDSRCSESQRKRYWIAVDGANFSNKDGRKEYGVPYQFQYSPEALQEQRWIMRLVCNAVIDVWKPTADRKVIINLPATVEMSLLPHVYTSQIEYMSRTLRQRECGIITSSSQ